MAKVYIGYNLNAQTPQHGRIPANHMLSNFTTDVEIFIWIMYLYLPDTPNTSRRVLRGVHAKMALIFSPNNQNITCKDVLIT